MTTHIVAPGGVSPRTRRTTPKSKTERLAAKLPKGMPPAELADLAGGNELVEVPFLPQPYRKAPKDDPYLKAETVTRKHLTVSGYSLPPILSGLQPGQDLEGQPKDYSVKVVWMSRQQIEAMLRSIENEQPAMGQALEIVRSFMCYLDTIRDSAKQYIISARNGIQSGNLEYAQQSLDDATEMLGRWNDELRLPLH